MRAFSLAQKLKNLNKGIFCQDFNRKLFCHKKFSAYLCKVKNSKEENSKKETKHKIIIAALNLFRKQGIREVKMDDIASLISVSKRTIYEIFTDKENLIIETLKYSQKQTVAEARKIIRSSNDILDIILKLYEHYFNLLRSTNRLFFTDLERYPEVLNRRKAREKRNNKRFLAWMEEGRKQGLFRSDADFEILAFILRRDLELIMTVNKQPENSTLSRYKPEDLGRLLILFYLRGIATAKGREKIEDFIQKNK